MGEARVRRGELASEPHPDLESEPRTPSLPESASQARLDTQPAPLAHTPALGQTRESSPRPQAHSRTPPTRPSSPGARRGRLRSAASAPKTGVPGPPAREEPPLQRSAADAAPGATTRAGAGGRTLPLPSPEPASPPTPPATRAQSGPGRRRGLRPAPSNREFSHW